MPLLPSRMQAELLTLVLFSHGREWTLTELAGRVGSSVATAQREVARAEQIGVVRSRRLGNTRPVTAATSRDRFAMTRATNALSCPHSRARHERPCRRPGAPQ
jgi:predicted transcriptional regulator